MSDEAQAILSRETEHLSVKFLLKIQKQLEDIDGASTGLDVTEFVRPYSGKTRKGELLVEQSSNFEDINLVISYKFSAIFL